MKCRLFLETVFAHQDILVLLSVTHKDVFFISYFLHTCTSLINTDEYRIAGTIIAAVGGKAWDAACDMGLLRPTIKSSVLALRLADVPAGTYEMKVSICICSCYEN